MNSTDISRALDKQIRAIAELPESALIELQSMLERAHLHVLIERSLRDGYRVSASPTRLRPITSDDAPHAEP